MSFYTDVTYVKPLTKIRRERVLPHDGELAVATGQQVTPLHVLARAPGQATYRIFNAAEKLGIPSASLPDHLLIQEGAAIEKGMPIMRKRSALGRTQRFGSPIEGVLHRVINGRLVIQQVPQLDELRALIHGYVANVVGDRGAVIETAGSLIQCLWGAGQDNVGKLKLVTTGPEEWLIAPNVTRKERDMVLVAGRLKDPSVFEAMTEHGVKGLIVGSMTTRLCLLARRLGLAVMVTDNIGTTPMASPVFRLLEQSVGRDVAVFSDEKAAPGSRPEIIIPLPASDEYVDRPESPTNAIATGQKVRLMRGELTGQVGAVVHVHDQPRRTPAGTRLSGADIELENGDVHFVPYSNMELIL